MTGVLSEVTTASGKFFERFEELEHAGKGRPVVNPFGTIGADSTLNPVVGARLTSRSRRTVRLGVDEASMGTSQRESHGDIPREGP